MPKGESSKLVLQIFPNGEVYDEHGIRLGITNWAEAIHVPSHGDLISREWLVDISLRLMNIAKNDDIANGVKWLWQYVIEAPTIIEADPEEENTK